MILLIDNYDSFSFNLVQALLVSASPVEVVRNDEISCEQIALHAPAGIVLSPGPGRPDEAGVTLEVIRRFLGRIPLLGVCLGHQALAHALGGRVIRAPTPVHGKASPIFHSGVGVFEGLPQGVEVGRYHSLVVERSSLGPELEVTAWTAEGVVMGLRHRSAPAESVQFHPESVLTPQGQQMLGRWVRGLSAAPTRADP